LPLSQALVDEYTAVERELHPLERRHVWRKHETKLTVAEEMGGFVFFIL
jgi:hypothetical protein